MENTYQNLSKCLRLCCYLLFLVHSHGFSQKLQSAEDFPTERIYAQVNTTLIFVGEYLMYSVYCLDHQSLEPSKISKIAYVELVGEDSNSVFKQKLILKDGRSFSDFFVSTAVPSGNYKLIAHTQWMRNFDSNLFFSQDVTVINPYNGDQSIFLNEKRDSLITLQREDAPDVVTEKKIFNHGSGLKIDLTNTKFETRQKVDFSIVADKKYSKNYNVSISVRKKDTIPHAQRVRAASLVEKGRSESLRPRMDGKTSIYLPELRGELLSGRVVEVETLKPAQGVQVSLSIPKHFSQFKTAYTNENGIYHFSISKEYESDIAIFQVLGAEREKYNIETQNSLHIDRGKHDFYNFQLTREMENFILERSFHNQIENAFFSVKPDTIPSGIRENPFFLRDGLEYDLDDYTRFATLRETVVEIIEHLWMTRDAEGNRIFKVRVEPPYVESDKIPLVLIDGIHIQDHESLMDFNARTIQKITLGRDRYVFGKQVYEGAICIETIDEVYIPVLNGTFSKQVELFKPQSPKRYYRQTYEGSENGVSERIPDFRYQLMWSPQESIDGAKTFSFFTSDVKGQFEIVIEGFTEDGTPISSSKPFSVH